MSQYLVQKRNEFEDSLVCTILSTSSHTKAEEVVDMLKSIEGELSKAYHETSKEPDTPYLFGLYKKCAFDNLTEQENTDLSKFFQDNINKAKKVFESYGIAYDTYTPGSQYSIEEVQELNENDKVNPQDFIKFFEMN